MKKWSQQVSSQSKALVLPEGIFTWENPKEIASSLKHSADTSKNKKGTSLQSAMSMLNFYINRAGKKLSAERKKILEKAKIELRKLYEQQK
jgi:hypothetical protein